MTLFKFCICKWVRIVTQLHPPREGVRSFGQDAVKSSCNLEPTYVSHKCDLRPSDTCHLWNLNEMQGWKPTSQVMRIVMIMNLTKRKKKQITIFVNLRLSLVSNQYTDHNNTV
jgi:hypothetical protein